MAAGHWNANPVEKARSKIFSATSATLRSTGKSWKCGGGIKRPSKIVVWLNYQTGEDRINRYLCDILDKVLSEGESAAYEPHGNNVMGQ